MINRRWFLLVLLASLSILTLSSSLLLAQTDDPEEPEPPFDWANLVLPPHPDFSEGMHAFSGLLPQEAPPPALVVEPWRESIQHTVQSGESLYRIARQYGSSIAAILASNELLNPSLIFPGTVLTIPVAAPPPTGSPPPNSSSPPLATNGRSYTVQSGDSLYRIARLFGVQTRQLIAANQIARPDVIFPGTVLIIPDSGGETAVPPPTNQPSPPPASPPSPPPATASTYTVRSGDSLSRIARQFGLSVEALAYANNISNWGVIYPGQVLNIPDPTIAVPPPSELPPSASGFIWPVDSRYIIQGYRVGHRAIDIVVSTGTPVLAIADGTVEFVGWNNHGYGNLVVLNHGDGVRSLYAHNDSFAVSADQAVRQGETIALSGNTGRSTMPHLHLEIMFDTFRVENPCDHLPGGC